MFFFVVSVLAGILTVLAPCILPLLPIVIGTAEEGKKGIAKRSWVVIGSLLVSVVFFTLLLKATTLFITIPQAFWGYFSGTLIVLVGLAIVFPTVWSRLPFVSRLSRGSNELLGAGYQKKNYTGDVIVGAALGPVFTTCSPTYLFIIATILPASLAVGLTYLLGFIIGLGLSLLLIAYFGQQLINAVSRRMGTAEKIKKIFGVLIIIVGLAILTGYDKKIEAFILDSGYGATIEFEDRLIEQFGRDVEEDVMEGASEFENKTAQDKVDIPRRLKQAFPDTDWSQADPAIENALSGGPGKDGIPALDNPSFVSLATFEHGDEVLAIVLEGEDVVKVYPYNILNWHEIVNDTIDGMPVAVTFCPLCGSAIVYDRRIDGETTTFGVSGFLLESNMIMYDRATESLWQQSTGKALAGAHFGKQLDILSMQLLSIGEIRSIYPDAVILSEDTGYRRDYGRNPYVGYEESDRFIFAPSTVEEGYHPKEIFVVYRVNEVVAGTPFMNLKEGQTYNAEIAGEALTLDKTDGELTITDSTGELVPFYIEMWFSYAVQHGKDIEVFDPDRR